MQAGGSLNQFEAEMPEVSETLGSGEIVKQLGSGSIGSVYLTHNPSLEINRAVKVLNPGFSEDNFRRFSEEAKIYAKIKHPHIVSLYSTGVWRNKLPFIEMEYLNAGTLEGLIKQQKLPLIVCLAVGIQIIRGLKHASSVQFSNSDNGAGVIHRDLKPANILLNSEGQVKIADFGMAKIGAISEHTQELTIPGTLPYMSPEQHHCQLDKIDKRTDIYAFGILFYELLNGLRPFPGENLQKMQIAKQNEAYKPLNEQLPEISKSLESIISKCLKVDLNQRWQNYGALLLALETEFKQLIIQSPESIIADFIKAPDQFNPMLISQSQNSFRRIGLKGAVALICFLALISVGFFIFFNPGEESIAEPIKSSETDNGTKYSFESKRPQNANQAHSQNQPSAKTPSSISSAKPSVKPSTKPSANASVNTSKPKIPKSIKSTQEAPKPKAPAANTKASNFAKGERAYKNRQWARAIQYLSAWEDEIAVVTSKTNNSNQKQKIQKKDFMLLESYVRTDNITALNSLIPRLKEPFDAHFWYWLGKVYISNNQIDLAIASLDKAIHLESIMPKTFQKNALRQKERLLAIKKICSDAPESTECQNAIRHQ